MPDTDSCGSDKQRPRKPYTLTKQREKWSEEEHARFLEAITLYHRHWRRVAEHVGTKKPIQVRSHAQKVFMKMRAEGNSHLVPPSKVQATTKPPSVANPIPPPVSAGQAASALPSETKLRNVQTDVGAKREQNNPWFDPSFDPSMMLSELKLDTTTLSGIGDDVDMLVAPSTEAADQPFSPIQQPPQSQSDSRLTDTAAADHLLLSHNAPSAPSSPGPASTADTWRSYLTDTASNTDQSYSTTVGGDLYMKRCRSGSPIPRVASPLHSPSRFQQYDYETTNASVPLFLACLQSVVPRLSEYYMSMESQAQAQQADMWTV